MGVGWDRGGVTLRTSLSGNPVLGVPGGGGGGGYVCVDNRCPYCNPVENGSQNVTALVSSLLVLK